MHGRCRSAQLRCKCWFPCKPSPPMATCVIWRAPTLHSLCALPAHSWMWQGIDAIQGGVLKGPLISRNAQADGLHLQLCSSLAAFVSCSRIPSALPHLSTLAKTVDIATQHCTH